MVEDSSVSPWSVSSESANAANVLWDDGGLVFEEGLVVRLCCSFSRKIELASWVVLERRAGLFFGETTVFHVVSG